MPRPCATGKPFHEIVSDQGKLYLRVVSVIPVRATSLTVVTSEPLDKDLVGKIAADLGEITLYPSPDEPPGPVSPIRREGFRLENHAFVIARTARVAWLSLSPRHPERATSRRLLRSPSVRARSQ